MTDTVLFDKLLKLRLPAFREGLREQQVTPNTSTCLLKSAWRSWLTRNVPAGTTTASTIPCIQLLSRSRLLLRISTCPLPEGWTAGRSSNSTSAPGLAAI